ncbi:MAG: DNA sulfur modification protein DndD [Microscillaceae bacterium]|nr:DNA sulfur modification protein DndD [Microscillaceae bacterium]
MKISEINLNNFRIYKNINSVLIDITEDKNITIVSGKNGFGKTTFLMSLVWCLYGKNTNEVDDFYKQEINEQGGYAKYIANSLNRLAKIEGNTKFFVSITFADVNISTIPCTTIKIIRSFDTNAVQSENIDILLYGDSEVEQYNQLVQEYGFDLFIRDYLIPLESAKFFFFDAEKIVSLAESNTIAQSRDLSKAYAEVLGIKKYEDLKENLEKVRHDYASQSAKPEQKRKFNELQTREENIGSEILEHKRTISELTEKLADYRSQSQELQNELIKAGQKITEDEKNRLQNDEIELRTKQDNIKKQLDELYDVIPLAISGNLLYQIKKQVEEENQYRNLKFDIENIEDKTEKILNELDVKKRNVQFPIEVKVQEFYNNQIRELIRKHFFDIPEEATQKEIKELHFFTEGEFIKLNELITRLKNDFKSYFRTLAKEYQENKRNLDMIRRKLNEAESKAEDPIISGFREKKILIDEEILKIEEETALRNQEIGKLEGEKNQVAKQISELRKLIELSDLFKDKDELARDLISELKDFISKFKKEKMKSLENRILMGLRMLMHKDNFVQRVDITMPDENIIINLINDRGEIIPKESLSKGEKQLYAMALLKSLVEESGINFPIFIDSPLQKLDKTHSKNVIRYFYPQVSEQVVILPTLGKELTREEYEILKPNIAQNYLIHNISKDSSQFKPVEDNLLFETYEKIYKESL